MLDTVNPETSFYLRVVPGSLVYYHPNAFGKILLAFMSEDEVRRILPVNLPGLTQNTITLRSDLISRLGEIREAGIAYDNEEYTSGICCIGAPVFDVEERNVAGLGITGFASWFAEDTKRKSYEKLVLECAHRTSKDIGYLGDYFADKTAVS